MVGAGSVPPQSSFRRLAVLSVGLLCGVGGMLLPAGCREENSAGDRQAEVLTVEGGAVHLLDHIDGAAVIDIPLYDEIENMDESRAALEALLEREEYQPTQVTLFPVPSDRVKLTRMKVDRETGDFLTQSAGADGPSSIQIAADVDLKDYDVLSIRFGSDVGGAGGVAWRGPGDREYSAEKSVGFDLGTGDMRTFHFVFRDRGLSELEQSLFSLVYETPGRTVMKHLPSGSAGWKGKLTSLLFMPTDKAARVTLESITLRSTKPVRHLIEGHGREALLAVLSSDSIAHYGRNVFVRKFGVSRIVEDGVLTFLPGELTFVLEVPEKAKLEFGYCVLPVSVVGRHRGVEFRITALPAGHDGPADEVFRSLFSTEMAPDYFSIIRGKVDLSPYAGKKISLTFRTELPGRGEKVGSAAATAAVWFDPVIRKPAHSDRLNVILISADTLRADHLGVYGYKRDTSPNLDMFASQGTVFANAYTTAPWTLPAHMSMMTSLYPLAHGVFEILDHSGPADQLEPDRVTLAELLKSAGYYTFALTDGSELFVLAEYGFANGFRHFDEKAGKRGIVGPDAKTWERTVGRLDRWIQQRRAEPFFAFIHTSQVHDPYYAPEPFGQKYVDPGYAGPLPRHWYRMRDHRPLIEKKGGPLGTYIADDDIRHLLDLYDGEVAYFDHHFKALIENLRKQGLLDKTLIIVTSDHGEEFGERGEAARHGHTLYDELLRVPLIVRWPDRVPAGLVVKENVSIVDIMPTVLDLCGVSRPEGLQGESLVPLLKGKPAKPRVLFAGGIRHRQAAKRLDVLEDACIDGALKAIDYGDYRPGVRELFDLGRDPKELESVLTAESGKAAAIFKHIEEYRARFPRRSRSAQKHIWTRSDEERLKTLRGLGYVK